ncbi:MAG: DUF1513 domain-containing protein [Shimia sp.]
MPARGHAAAAHPARPLAIAFARRPGTFALAVDCASGRVVATMQAPPGRHFYGHGAFTADGARFLTTENDYEAARGVIGIWDAATFTRLAEVPSGGIGPHEIVRTATGFAVANGGIETHPDSGRTKLNLATMRSNLTYLDRDFTITQQVHLPSDHRLNSIRHIAYAAGRVAMGMQWQGQGPAPAIVAVASDQGVRPLPSTDRALAGYTGSVAISLDGKWIASTHPRGNAWLEFGGDTAPTAGLSADVEAELARYEARIATAQERISTPGEIVLSRFDMWEDGLWYYPNWGAIDQVINDIRFDKPTIHSEATEGMNGVSVERIQEFDGDVLIASIAPRWGQTIPMLSEQWDGIAPFWRDLDGVSSGNLFWYERDVLVGYTFESLDRSIDLLTAVTAGRNFD